jgi:hypothetical protein
MRQKGNVARMGSAEVYTGFWWENLRERDNLEDPRFDGRIILRWINQEMGYRGMDSINMTHDRNR